MNIEKLPKVTMKEFLEPPNIQPVVKNLNTLDIAEYRAYTRYIKDGFY